MRTAVAFICRLLAAISLAASALAVVTFESRSASAQTCIGHEATWLERNARLTKPGAYFEDGIKGSWTEDNDTSGIVRARQAQGHAFFTYLNRYGTSSRLVVHVYRSPTKKLMCPDVAITEVNLGALKEGANGLTDDGAKRDVIEITLRVGDSRKRIHLAYVVLDENTPPHFALTMDVPDDFLPDARDLSTEVFAIKALWWGVTSVSNAGKENVFHETGDDKPEPLNQLRSKPFTKEDLLSMDQERRRSSWHGGGRLADPSLYTPLKQELLERFPQLLTGASELTTSLEGEAEYVLASKDERDVVVQQLDTATREKLDGMTVEKLDGKEVTDTYYDFPDHRLLRAGILVRRRQAAKDPKGLFKFSVKGWYLKGDGAMVRLASEVNLNENEVAITNEALTSFFLDSQWNPLARVAFQSMIRMNVDTGDLGGKTLAPVLIVQSERTRYKIGNIEQNEAQAIEISVDHAVGYLPKSSETTKEYYSVEFGIDHPGIQISSETEDLGKEYHTELDVDKARFERTDVRTFRLVVAQLATTISLPINVSDNNGGFKAQTLARALGLLD
jgi:hypothetical protein